MDQRVRLQDQELGFLLPPQTAAWTLDSGRGKHRIHLYHVDLLKSQSRGGVLLLSSLLLRLAVLCCGKQAKSHAPAATYLRTCYGSVAEGLTREERAWSSRCPQGPALPLAADKTSTELTADSAEGRLLRTVALQATVLNKTKAFRHCAFGAGGSGVLAVS